MTVEIARQIAERHPGAALPCPVCEASVVAANLDRHLAKVHMAELQAPTRAGPQQLPGVDRRIRSAMLVPVILWVIGVGVLFGTGAPVDGVAAAVIGGALILLFILLLLALLGAFEATLVLDGEQVRLRWTLGCTRVELPAELHSGKLVEQRAAAMGYGLETGASRDQRAGNYLALTSGGRTIRVGCPKAGKLGKHWDQEGWSAGPTRRRWDITVDRAAMVALHYHLAARGQLAPKPTPAPGRSGDDRRS